MSERKGSLHESAYQPRKPRQFSKFRSNGADPGRGNLAVTSMDESRRSATFEARLRDNGTCQFCGEPASDAITITHIKRGGTWTISNVALSCTPCELAGRLRSCDTLISKRTAIRTIRGLDPDG